jgi:predicted enzyme related to lactoylglutathione lyase
MRTLQATPAGIHSARWGGTTQVPCDVEKVAAAVKANGGKVVMEKATIPGVGDLIFFEDPEGNLAGAMRYDDKAE